MVKKKILQSNTIHHHLKRKQKLLWNKPKSKRIHNENLKTLTEEIKGCTRRWKGQPCSQDGGTKVVKITILSKTVYRLTAISFKITVSVTEIEIHTHTHALKYKRSQRVILSKIIILKVLTHLKVYCIPTATEQQGSCIKTDVSSTA